ncbi:MAG: hypothetical protein FJW46_06845 [Actinobacteria bacterium]|nr:hypothetical protein [Actinomycetota bacterium]
MRIHISNATARNATVVAIGIKSYDTSIPAKDGFPVTFKRYIAAGESTLHSDLVKKFGESYSKALIESDPEVDLETVGRSIDGTTSVLMDKSGNPLYCAPEVFEIIYGVDGKEVERRTPLDVAPNVNEDVPIKWTGRLIPRSDLVRKFAIKRTMQIKHADGVTFDFLHAIAKELEEKDSVMLLASGVDGKSPLVFQTNGTPYRGFLEGRTAGEGFLLLLHLSNMELKRPT